MESWSSVVFGVPSVLLRFGFSRAAGTEPGELPGTRERYILRAVFEKRVPFEVHFFYLGVPYDIGDLERDPDLENCLNKPPRSQTLNPSSSTRKLNFKP